MRRIRGHPQNLGVEDIHEDVVDQGAGRLDHGQGGVCVRCDQRHVEPFKGRRVGDGVVRHGHADIEDALTEHAEDVPAVDPHLVVGRQVGGNAAVACRRHLLVPKGLLELLVQRQSAPAAHHRKLFGEGARARESDGEGQKA